MTADPATTPALSGAIISGCGTYRYHLWRSNLIVARQVPRRAPRSLVFVMLNPSTADADRDDPTIRKCIGYARRDRFDRLDVVNLYALRATDPDELWRHAAPVGAGNDETIASVCRGAGAEGRVVAAWGRHGIRDGRGRYVHALLAENAIPLYCLSTNNDGSPSHPLYLPGAAPFRAWEPR